MNLICFPHYTCGGLLCDIFQDTFSTINNNGGIESIQHSIGKIGDADSIFDDYNTVDLMAKLNLTQPGWAGTHCWPGILPDISQLNQVILITTTTNRSKLYRWIRAYYHYYEKSQPWQEVSGLARIDKERETAKNYIKPFLPITGSNVINIEFAEIVDNSIQFQKLTAEYKIVKHIDRWKKINNFLYNPHIWNSPAVKRFYEAEVEVNLNQHYIYE